MAALLSVVTLHDVRQFAIDYLQRLGRLTQPSTLRRGAGRAAAEAGASAARALDHTWAAASASTDEAFRRRLRLAVDAIDEAVFWLELLRLTHPAPHQELDALITEGQELAGMLATADRPERRLSPPIGRGA